MNNLRNTLLEQDGLDPAGVTEQELTQFRTLLNQERKRAKKLQWLVQIPMFFGIVALIGLNMSESLLETLNIPFVSVFGLLILAFWIVLISWTRRLAARLGQSQKIILILKHKLSEHANKSLKDISLVARYKENKYLFWPGILLVTLFAAILAVIVGNVKWWFMSGSVLQFPIIWWSAFGALILGLVIRFGLKMPISTLRELESLDSRLWIAAPRIASAPIPRLFWRIGLVCLIGISIFIGILSIYLFFQGNDMYGRATLAFERAQSIHAVGYSFEDDQRIKAREIWYQKGKGTHIQSLRDNQIVDMYDDGEYRYDYVQGNTYAVEKKTEQSLLPQELTDLPCFLKWSRRYSSRDKQVRGAMYRCYRRQNSNARHLLWIDWISGTPRVRAYEEYRRVEGEWEQEKLIEIEYDQPMDLIIPPDVFEQEGIKIVESESVSRSEYSLDRALATTEVLGLTFAVQDLKRWGDTLLLTCSVRATGQSLRVLENVRKEEEIPTVSKKLSVISSQRSAIWNLSVLIGCRPL